MLSARPGPLWRNTLRAMRRIEGQVFGGIWSLRVRPASRRELDVQAPGAVGFDAPVAAHTMAGETGPDPGTAREYQRHSALDSVADECGGPSTRPNRLEAGPVRFRFQPSRSGRRGAGARISDPAVVLLHRFQRGQVPARPPRRPAGAATVLRIRSGWLSLSAPTHHPRAAVNDNGFAADGLSGRSIASIDTTAPPGPSRPSRFGIAVISLDFSATARCVSTAARPPGERV